MSFSARLREERKRLKYTQKQLAAKMEVTEQVQVAYEKDRLPQFADYLEKLAASGFDVPYVITGEHGGVHLTDEESELLALIRQANPAVRKTALEVLRSGMVITTKQVSVGRDNFGAINL